MKPREGGFILSKSNWWINESGQNQLLLVPADVIADFIFRIPAARDDFNDAYRQLSEEQRSNLDEALVPHGPRLKTFMVDVKDQHDQRQSRWNKAGVRTAGRMGGRRRGGNR